MGAEDTIIDLAFCSTFKDYMCTFTTTAKQKHVSTVNQKAYRNSIM